MRPAWLLDAPFAHRGLWLANGPPENSAAAFAAAAAAGLGVELDVRLTKDEQPVVFHDDILDRTTNARGPLSALTWDELRDVQLKDGANIPSLIDVLALHPRTPLLVEMKVNAGAEGPLEARVAALLMDYPGKAAVMSFNPRSLALIAEAAPHIARGQLSSGVRMEDGKPVPLEPEDDAGAHLSRPHFLSIHVDSLARFGAPLAVKLNVPLITWTVRTEAHLAQARAHARNWIFEALPVESVALAG